MATIPRNYIEARKAADDARDKANRIKADIAAGVRHEISMNTQNGKRYAKQNVQLLIDRLTSADPEWQTAVKLNQWYIQYATMYGQGAIIAQLHLLIQEIRGGNTSGNSQS
jgi:hypothetical protein